MWLNPPALQPAALSVLEHSCEDSMDKKYLDEKEKPQPEKQSFSPSHVYNLKNNNQLHMGFVVPKLPLK